jgi:hypothetical protein
LLLGSIVTDGRGDSYVTGTFSGMETFGAGEDNETVLTPEGNTDIFVAKYGSRLKGAAPSPAGSSCGS